MIPKSTPDERFLIKLYQTAMKNGDPHMAIDFRGVAIAIGQKKTAIKNIIKHLAQANFITKVDETTICLTEHGCNLVLDIFRAHKREEQDVFDCFSIRK